MKFGQKLKRLRKQKGYTQAELADNAGISLRTIIYYEKGDSYPRSRETYKTLADILDTDVNYLIVEEDEEIGAIKSSSKIEKIVGELNVFFSNNSIPTKDKEKLMLEVEKVFWNTRRKIADDRETKR